MFRFSYDSGLNGKCGVYGQSGLYDKSGLYPVEFNVQNLDPYLLFDTSQGSMLGTLESPTLDLDPSNPDTLNVITASRSSVATRTLPDGSIALAEQDTVRVDYTQGEQLTPTVYQHFGQTSFDDPAWQKITTSITADDALAPDGTATADRMVIPPTANSQSSRLTEESNITSGTTVTISFYAKADGSINPLVLFANGSVFARILFNLQSETSSFVDGALSITHSIEEAANGFYRCSATFNSAGIGSISIRNATAGDGVSSLLLWGPQLEEGTTASDFVENTTGSPKFTGISATYSARVPMVLIEPSATNLVTYSEDFSDSSWTKLGAGTGSTAVVTSNYATSPDGTQNADRLQCDLNGGGDSSSNQSLIFDAYTSSGNQSISIYVKSNTGLNQTVYFANTQTTGDTITVTNEWQRFEFNHSSSTRVLAIGLRGRSGGSIDDTADILIWGAQAEAGSVATSYIPTSGGDAAARTRAADDLQIERDSTNLVSYSTPDTNWPLSGATRIEDFASSPDGSQTATKITKVGTDANERTFFEDVALSNGTQYSASVYLKNVDVQGHTTLGVRVAGGTLFRIKIEWSTNTVFNDNGTTSDRFVRDVGDGWYRIGFSFTADGTNSDLEVDVDRSGAGATDTSSVLVWGAQLEEGESTSLIPTSGTTASRTTFSDFDNQSEGTVYVEMVDKTPTENSAYVAGPTMNQTFLYSNVDLAVDSYDGVNFQRISGVVANELFRAAATYDPTSKKISLNGTTLADGPHNGNWADATNLNIGWGGSGNANYPHMNGHLKRLIYWPTESGRL